MKNIYLKIGLIIIIFSAGLVFIPPKKTFAVNINNSIKIAQPGDDGEGTDAVDPDNGGLPTPTDSDGTTPAPTDGDSDGSSGGSGITLPGSSSSSAWEDYIPGDAKHGTLEDLVGKIIGILLGIAGVVAVIYIIIGGYQYVTAQGNADAAMAARSTILNALIGLVIIFSAYAIIKYFMDHFFK